MDFAKGPKGWCGGIIQPCGLEGKLGSQTAVECGCSGWAFLRLEGDMGCGAGDSAVFWSRCGHFLLWDPILCPAWHLRSCKVWGSW